MRKTPFLSEIGHTDLICEIHRKSAADFSPDFTRPLRLCVSLSENFSSSESGSGRKSYWLTFAVRCMTFTRIRHKVADKYGKGEQDLRGPSQQKTNWNQCFCGAPEEGTCRCPIIPAGCSFLPAALRIPRSCGGVYRNSTFSYRLRVISSHCCAASCWHTPPLRSLSSFLLRAGVGI